MDVAVKIVGIVIVCLAVVYLLKPDVMKYLMEFFKKGKLIYLAGLIRLALAVVFLLAARECRVFRVILVFGILFIISGFLVFVIPLEKIKSYIGWWQKQSFLVLRLLALIALAIGAVIIYSA
ncbi:MAG: hypothetical protein MUP16_00105 [Sedimentisphaerales bacterium]|nr:hypothetical protein [Sedimentisphaerales bacterium]